ncbi:uncharacterized protein [Penaeus vannamei]|uniref:uncharacterized protein n=1 Tax=Penaeus vannamei TaxID=6689 RepID=UPI00387F7433
MDNQIAAIVPGVPLPACMGTHGPSPQGQDPNRPINIPKRVFFSSTHGRPPKERQALSPPSRPPSPVPRPLPSAPRPPASRPPVPLPPDPLSSVPVPRPPAHCSPETPAVLRPPEPPAPCPPVLLTLCPLPPVPCSLHFRQPPAAPYTLPRPHPPTHPEAKGIVLSFGPHTRLSSSSGVPSQPFTLRPRPSRPRPYKPVSAASSLTPSPLQARFSLVPHALALTSPFQPPRPSRPRPYSLRRFQPSSLTPSPLQARFSLVPHALALTSPFQPRPSRPRPYKPVSASSLTPSPLQARFSLVPHALAPTSPFQPHPSRPRPYNRLGDAIRDTRMPSRVRHAVLRESFGVRAL